MSNPSLSHAALSSSTICVIVSFQAWSVICIMPHDPDEWTKKFATHFLGAHVSSRSDAASAIIPAGSWPRRMPAAIAAGYCGERTAEAFLKRVGSEYPQPRIKDGGLIWIGPLHRTLCRATSPRICDAGTAAPALR
jgi:hypothetical protein